jgi:hypothetical protein
MKWLLLIPIVLLAVANVHAADPLECRFEPTDAYWCVRVYSPHKFAVSHSGKSERDYSLPPGEFVNDDHDRDAAVNLSFQMAITMARSLNASMPK